MARLIITLSKKTGGPALFTRKVKWCYTEPFALEFLFEFQPQDHPQITVKGTLESEDPFFQIDGSKSFSFDVVHRTKTEKTVVIKFPNVEGDMPDTFRILLNVDTINGIDLSLRHATIHLQEKP